MREIATPTSPPKISFLDETLPLIVSYTINAHKMIALHLSATQCSKQRLCESRASVDR